MIQNLFEISFNETEANQSLIKIYECFNHFTTSNSFKK